MATDDQQVCVAAGRLIDGALQCAGNLARHFTQSPRLEQALWRMGPDLT